VIQHRTYKVGIAGSYGGLNMGDEAILHCIISELRRSLPVEITVFSRNPEDTLRRHPVEKAFAVREMTRGEACREMKGLDLFIFGGGGILFDSEAEIYMREVQLANDMGIPVMVYAVSAGPLKTRGAQQLVREALNHAAIISVRERGAKRTLENAGVEKEILVTADPAFCMEPEPMEDDLLMRDGMDESSILVGMSVREPGPAAPDIDHDVYHGLLADAADFIIDRYGAHVVFMPMERGMRDMQHSHAVASRMLRPQHATVLKGDYTAGQLLYIMGRFTFAVGMRLHFLIFAAIQGIPFVALPYSEKVQGLLQDLEVETPPMNLVNAGRLIAHIDHYWDHRDELRAHIDRRIPELRERAKENNRLLVKLLGRLPERTNGEAPLKNCRI
jgi:polysaccharide pyruvyl transferase CsaB